jgi:RNA 3'-terminal phosphate cyclase (ATP)
MIKIDGSSGEGGGQLLRTCLSLAALTGRPFRLENIRAGRSKPGLRPQHLTAVRAVAAICGAELSGDTIDSQALEFRPGNRAAAGQYHFDVSEASKGGFSAGAVTLILQTVLWPLLFARESSMVTLRGGTQVPFSPPFHYLAQVVGPAFLRFGVHINIELRAWGWQTAGNGVVTAELEPVSQLKAVSFTPVATRHVEGVAAVTNLPAHIPQRMANRAHNLLQAAGFQPVIRPLREQGAGPGAGIVLWLPQAGFSALGRPGLPADQVAEAAVSELLAFIDDPDAAVDEHLADQLLLPMALAHGQSTFTTHRLTRHTLTNADLLRHWLDVEIEIEGEVDKPGKVVVDGVNFAGIGG